jgi:hypothetical protein
VSVSNVTIQGFRINGGISFRPYHGSPCSKIKILDNHIIGAYIGINLKNDILISGNTFENTSNDTIKKFGNHWTIRNNVTINGTGSSDVHMDFWQSFFNLNASSYSSALINLLKTAMKTSHAQAF